MSRSPELSREPSADALATEPSCTSFTSWAEQVLCQSGQVMARHHRFMIARLEAVIHGEIDRLMILMPPGSAKSTYASVLFPAWWFTQHPSSSIIAAAHTADLARHFARQVRDLVIEHRPILGYELLPGQRATARWRTSSRGEYFATGVRGPITGRRADLVIIDDPIKSLAEANSLLWRERLWEWFRADLTTRLKPRGRMVLVMTRWHEYDLAGHLLAHHPDEWHQVRLPALAEANDPLGRVIGEPLWPEWEDDAALRRKRNAVGERVWSALFQQSPRPMQGNLFKASQIDILDTAPPTDGQRMVRAWDLAATRSDGDNDPDYTVGLKLLHDTSGRWVVLDVIRFRGSPLRVEQELLAAADLDGALVTIGLPEDPGQAGKSQVSHYVRLLSGYRVRASRETGSKLTRAMPVASQVEAGNLLMVRGSWNHAFLEEVREFPFGRKDDQVDALSRAFTMLSDAGKPARRVTMPLLVR